MGSSAIVVILDDTYLDGVDKALTKADEKISRAIDPGDRDELQKAISEASDDVS